MEDNSSNEINGIDIRCPNCNHANVTVCEDSQGHFQVTSCYDCGYNKPCKLKD
jgi:predicted RNA-binding Zn-ribbon protein involved in translation (DUF1610 family)